MALTDSQQQAVAELYAFLTDPDEKFFVLSGPAGSGKTYMLQHFEQEFEKQWIVERVIDSDLPKSVSFYWTATTHKAAGVLAEKGFNTTTVHACLGLLNRWDKAKREHLLIRSKTAKEPSGSFQELAVLVVDEASMIGKDLYRHIEKWVIKSPYHKVIFVGDRCQLPPINETEAVPFSPFLDFPGYTLTEVLRQGEGTPLANLVQQFRKRVTDLIPQKVEVPPEIQSFDFGDREWYSLMQDRMPHPGALGAVVLCYTNNGVQDYVRYLRDYWDVPETPVEGEVLALGCAIASHSKILLRQGDIFEVDRKEPEVQTVLHRKCAGHRYWDARTGVSVFVPDDVNDKTKIGREVRYSTEQGADEAAFRVHNTWAVFSHYHASTVHKAQGSTYSTVFLDMVDFHKCRDKATIDKLLYVAASRASHELFIRR